MVKLVVALLCSGCSTVLAIDEGHPIGDVAVDASLETGVDSAARETVTPVSSDATDAAQDLAVRVARRFKLPPPAGVTFAGGPALTGWYAQPHQVFVGSTSGTVYVATEDVTPWSAWLSIGGSVVGDLAAVHFSAPRLDVFGVDKATSRLSHTWYPVFDSDGAWRWPAEWALRPTNKINGAAAGCSRAGETFDVFAKAETGELLHTTFDRRFSDWIVEPGVSELDSTPAVASEMAGSNEALRTVPYEIAYRTTGGALAVQSWTGDAFGPRTTLGPIVGRPSIAIRKRLPAATSPRDLFVAARSADNTLVIYRRRDGVWQGPVDTGDVMASAPSVFSRSSAELFAAFLGPDGAVHVISLD